MIAALAGALGGAVLASFAATCADRLTSGRSPWSGRSHCERCNATLAAWELLPLLSFLALRGACRRCRARIPRRLLLAEVAGAGCGATLVTFAPEDGLALARLAMLATALALHVLTDLREGYVYDVAVYPVLLAIVALAYVDGRTASALEGVCVCAGALSLIVGATRGRGMGVGDVKVAAVVGAALGPRAGVVALAAAFVWGAAYAMAALAARRVRWGAHLAFIPFLALGTLTAVLSQGVHGPRENMLPHGSLGTPQDPVVRRVR